MKNQKIELKSKNKSRGKMRLEKLEILPFKPTRKLVKKIAGTVIQETTDYGMFDSTYYSRTIRNTHVTKLSTSFKRNEQLIPIVVVKVKDGNSVFKYRILEGHHRWYAAQKNNTPLIFMVYEFVDDAAEEEFYTTVNSNVKRMSDIDYLKMGIDLKKPSYEIIQKIMTDEDFSFLDMTKLLNLKGNEKFRIEMARYLLAN
jgi:ParB-like nuclease domain